MMSGRGAGSGGRRGGYFNNRGRGHFQWKRRKENRSSGQERTNGGSGNVTDNSEDYQGHSFKRKNKGNHSGRSNDPPTKKPRVDPLQTIKKSVENQWRKLLPGYDLYYCDTPPQVADFNRKLEAVQAFLTTTGLCEDTSKWERNDADYGSGENYFMVNVENVLDDKEFCSCWPDFEQDIVNEPSDTIKLWSCAAHKVVYENVLSATRNVRDEKDYVAPVKLPEISRLELGFFGSSEVTPFKSIKTESLNKFVTIRGTVIRSGDIHPFFTRLSFRCKTCNTIFSLEQPDGEYTLPTHCEATGAFSCNNTSFFEPLLCAPTNVVKDCRNIKIQDVLHCDIERGSVPKTIDCVLYGSLVKECSTGDAVTLSGIVKMHKAVGASNQTRDQSLLQMYVEVSAIKQHKKSERTMGGHLFSFTNKDYYAIKEIHDTPNIFRVLVASLCPSIFGHELVKAGMLLCLFSGTTHSDEVVTKRSDINMLMVGDPGLGKSQMLKIIAEASPRAVYVCGSGSTVAGLTVTIIKDGDQLSLEGGALVIANNGVCCIDEFDKMEKQHPALLEAMEQQSVSVAKSGVFRTLSARTTVIAAANPVGGHYDRCKTVSENIKINPALMSRFDLIFILLDKPDEESDLQLVNHKIRGSNNNSTAKMTEFKSQEHQMAGSVPQRLIDKVKIQQGEVLDLLPLPLIRKYIAYAKQYVHPKLTAESRVVLKEYYKNLRAARSGKDSTPVTARQLESLVRLAEARAKLELREEVTESDANDVIELFEFSLSSAFDSDVHGISSLSNSIILNSTLSGSKPKSVVSQAKKLLAVLQASSRKQCKNLFSVSEIKSCAALCGNGGNVTTLIAALNNEGYLLKKGGNTYQLATTDY